MFWFCCGLMLGFWLSHRYVVQDLRQRLSRYETKDGYVERKQVPEIVGKDVNETLRNIEQEIQRGTQEPLYKPGFNDQKSIKF